MIYTKNLTVREQSLIKIKEIDNRIFEDFCQSTDSISLLNGLSGIPFFYLKLYSEKKEKKYLKKISFVIDKVIANVNNPGNSYGYANGLAGTGLMLNYFLVNGLIDDSVNSYLNDLDEELIRICEELLVSGNLDFLHGAVGLLYYLNQRLTNSKNSEQIMKLYELFLDSVKKEIDLKTNSQASFFDGVKVKHLNFGMAHGITSYLYLLTEIFNVYPNSRKLTDVLNSIIDIFSESQNKNVDGSLGLASLPSIINENEIVRYDVPLGWCYGDGISSFAIFKAGKLLDSSIIKDNALVISKKSLLRNTTVSANVFDASMCHGTSSNAVIYKNWHQVTLDKSFKDAYENWIDLTLKIGNLDDGVAGYKRYYGNGSRINYGILDGAAGIGLVLADFVYGSTPELKWEKMLMIG